MAIVLEYDTTEWINSPEVIVASYSYEEMKSVVYIPQKYCSVEKQCVRFAESLLNRRFYADARNIKSEIKEPCLNCGVLLKEGLGHIAIITKIESASFEVIEQNRISCGQISTRSIEFNDSIIRGYVKPF